MKRNDLREMVLDSIAKLGGSTKKEYVADVVDANIKAAHSEKLGNGEVINIGKGGNYSVNEIAEIIGGDKEFIGDRLEPRETLADTSKAKELLDRQAQTDIKDWLTAPQV